MPLYDAVYMSLTVQTAHEFKDDIYAGKGTPQQVIEIAAEDQCFQLRMASYS